MRQNKAGGPRRTVSAMRLTQDLLLLPRLVRRSGGDVNAERSRLYLRALAEIDLARVDDVRAASRSALVSRQADLAPFEIAFDLFWALVRGGVLPGDEPTAPVPGGDADRIVAPLDALPRGMAPAVQ